MTIVTVISSRDAFSSSSSSLCCLRHHHFQHLLFSSSNATSLNLHRHQHYFSWSFIVIVIVIVIIYRYHFASRFRRGSILIPPSSSSGVHNRSRFWWGSRQFLIFSTSCCLHQCYFAKPLSFSALYFLVHNYSHNYRCHNLQVSFCIMILARFASRFWQGLISITHLPRSGGVYNISLSS